MKVRTIANLVEREGEQIQTHVEKKAEHILEAHGFNTDGLLIDQEKAKASIEYTEALLDPKVVSQAVKEFNSGQAKEKQIDQNELRESFEDPKRIKANISIDDVCCKKQKAEDRKKGSPPKEKREMVNNTVSHIQNRESKVYTLNARTIPQMMVTVLAFLLSNDLLSTPGSLVVFTDGARDLRSAIQDIFSFIPFKIILDWYHLEKKCKDLLSMAINGKQIKNQILAELLALLWRGKVDQAINLLRDVKADHIKNAMQRDGLITYLSRNRDCIPCYALRKQLGLRISSNPVEKANDLLVSERQKHNGMSWSTDGSTSLATLTCVRHNREDCHWLLHHHIHFQFDAATEIPAA